MSPQKLKTSGASYHRAHLKTWAWIPQERALWNWLTPVCCQEHPSSPGLAYYRHHPSPQIQEYQQSGKVKD